MTAGIKANVDGSAAIQVGGTDYITISSAGAVAIPQTFAVTGTSTFTGAATLTGGVAGDFKMNSGYGSVATAYGCRAWVNFNGTANTNLSGTYSQSGTTVTVTATAHGLIAGNSIYSDITTGTAVDGVYTVATVTDANTFTYTAGTSLTTSGNITLIRSTIRASGNVSSVADNGTGDYTVNFTVAMVDVNYAAVGNSSTDGTYTGIAVNMYTKSTGGNAVFAPTTTTLRLTNVQPNVGPVDSSYMTVAIFR
jgi:hypothetical protein